MMLADYDTRNQMILKVKILNNSILGIKKCVCTIQERKEEMDIPAPQLPTQQH